MTCYFDLIRCGHLAAPYDGAKSAPVRSIFIGLKKVEHVVVGPGESAYQGQFQGFSKSCVTSFPFADGVSQMGQSVKVVFAEVQIEAHQLGVEFQGMNVR